MQNKKCSFFVQRRSKKTGNAKHKKSRTIFTDGTAQTTTQKMN